MNDSYSASDNDTPKKESGFLFDDWDLPEEKSPTESVTSFDGKIIARMPDLGSESIAPKMEPSTLPAIGGQMHSPVSSLIHTSGSASAPTRQRLFQRVSIFGGVLLLCGMGILLLHPDENGQHQSTIDLAETLANTVVSLPGESVAIIGESAFLPIVPQESGNVMSGFTGNPAIPVAPVEKVAVASPPSPWDRPAVDAHSSWETPRAPEPPNPFLPIGGPAIDPVPTMPSETVPMSPMTPLGTPSMGTPSMVVSPYEMQVSPFETQRLTQSNTPTYPHPPVGTHVPPTTHSTIPPGMMPMRERQVNAPTTGVAPQQNTQWNPSAAQQVSSNTPGYATSSGNHGQVSPHTQYVVPPGYMLPTQQIVPQAVPQHIPIPSGISTLPTHGGQPVMPNGVPVPNVPSDFYYHNAPSQTQRRVF